MRCQSVTCQNRSIVPLPAPRSAAGCCCSVSGSAALSGKAGDAECDECDGDGGGGGDSNR